MKRKVLVIVIIMIAIAGFDHFQEEISRRVVHHIEAGNFVNADDLQLNKVTMLHWFSKEVQVYSKSNKELFFAEFNPYRGYYLYKNKKLVMQNESSNYPKYQTVDYMVFSINGHDYKDNRVDFYSEVVLDNPNFLKYDSNFFVGTYHSINNLIITKKTIDVIMIILLIGSSLLMIWVNKKELYLVLLTAGSLVILLDFQIGVMCAVLMIYYASGRQSKKSIKRYILPIILLASLVLPFTLFKIYSFIFVIISVMNYYKNRNIQSIVGLTGIVSILGLTWIDFRFSIFRLFYKDLFIAVVAIFMITNSVLKLRMYFAKERMVRVDSLRGLSHDLRLPLSTIKLNTELLEKDDFKSELNKGIIFHIIKGAIDDLVKMSSNFTAYISQDNYVDSKYRTSVHDCIEHTISYFNNNEKNIEIRSILCDEEIYLPIDKMWLNRLIYNLLDNAYKYTNDYGEIIISLRKVKQKVILSVEDNGIGMTQEQQSKVIEPFYRVDQSRSISGLGLGLSIVKTIVENLDGEMKIASEFGSYTKFTIEI